MTKSKHEWLYEAIDKWEEVTIKEYLNKALCEDIDLDLVDDELTFIMKYANSKRIAIREKYLINLKLHFPD